jgi:hypothetical protein
MIINPRRYIYIYIYIYIYMDRERERERDVVTHCYFKRYKLGFSAPGNKVNFVYPHKARSKLGQSIKRSKPFCSFSGA